MLSDAGLVVGWHDLAFETAEVRAISSLGTRFTRRIATGMPKIPDESTDLVFYLYENEEDARAGRNFGGTGFLVGVPSKAHDDTYHVYGVTNRHVAIDDGISVVRVNTRDGRTETFDYGPHDWTAHPDGYDLAIVRLPQISPAHKIKFVGADSFLTEQLLKDWEIGLGDDVFMVGRFVDHDGGNTNAPSVRFGNISVMPTPVEKYRGRGLESYLLDMHSRTGFSGSPVFVYRTPGGAIGKKVTVLSSTFSFFLGVHWGQFPEVWPVFGKGRTKESHNALSRTKQGADEYVKGVSGITMVVPAQRLLEIFELPAEIRWREMEDEKINPATKPVRESARPDAEKGDELLRSFGMSSI